VNQATKIGLDNVAVPLGLYKLLPVPPPGPDFPGNPAKPGFPLNGSQTVEVGLRVNASNVAVPTVTVYYFQFDGAVTTDGVNYGPLTPGVPVRFVLDPVVAAYIQIEVSDHVAPTMMDFVRVVGR